MSTQQTITVALGDRSYPILIGSKLLENGVDLSAFVAGKDCLLVSNSTVAPLYAEALMQSLGESNVTLFELPDGEAHKTLHTLSTVLDRLVDSGANRDALVIALGGGVVGDIAGFAAACYMRGIAFLQVPTTLLAQVDSSVGGKTGVNHEQGKNLIGAFHQPDAVVIDTDTLNTLPERELKAGLAEVIKYGAACDAAFFDWLENNLKGLLERDSETLAYAIRRSCELKADVVAADEREAGRRAILNFGHTFGHAIENSLGYGNWLHGEAVAAGMIMAAKLSGLPAADVARLTRLIDAAGLPIAPPSLESGEWLRRMGMDKKVQSKQLRFVLLHALGDAYVTSSYDEALLADVLDGTL